MPIVAAAVVPHSPLLIPSIAKEHAGRSAAVLASLQMVGQEIYACQPDTLVVLTPHGQATAGTSAIEVADTLTGRLVEFGEMKTALTARGAVGLSHRLKEAAEDAGVPLLLQTTVGLDYGVTIPWQSMWTESMPWNVLPILVRAESTEGLLRLGDLLREFFQSRPERIALLASGDTNRRASSMNDSDRRPTADERLIAEAITTGDASRLASLSAEQMCLRDPLMTLLSALNGLSWKGQLRIFDVPLTVGQVVADFQET